MSRIYKLWPDVKREFSGLGENLYSPVKYGIWIPALYVFSRCWFLGGTAILAVFSRAARCASLVAAGKPVQRQSAGHLSVKTADSVVFGRNKLTPISQVNPCKKIGCW